MPFSNLFLRPKIPAMLTSAPARHKRWISVECPLAAASRSRASNRLICDDWRSSSESPFPSPMDGCGQSAGEPDVVAMTAGSAVKPSSSISGVTGFSQRLKILCTCSMSSGTSVSPTDTNITGSRFLQNVFKWARLFPSTSTKTMALRKYVDILPEGGSFA